MSSMSLVESFQSLRIAESSPTPPPPVHESKENAHFIRSTQSKLSTVGGDAARSHAPFAGLGEFTTMPAPAPVHEPSRPLKNLSLNKSTARWPKRTHASTNLAAALASANAPVATVATAPSATAATASASASPLTLQRSTSSRMKRKSIAIQQLAAGTDEFAAPADNADDDDALASLFSPRRSSQSSSAASPSSALLSGASSASSAFSSLNVSTASSSASPTSADASPPAGAASDAVARRSKPIALHRAPHSASEAATAAALGGKTGALASSMGAFTSFMHANFASRDFDTHGKQRLLATPHKSPVRSTTTATRRPARLSVDGDDGRGADDGGSLFADADADALGELPPRALSKRESYDRIDEDLLPPPAVAAAAAPRTPQVRAAGGALSQAQLIAAAEAALFSPYKPPTAMLAPKPAAAAAGDASDAQSHADQSAGGEPAAKRRPASCMMRASTTLGQLVSASGEVFLRSEPTDALHHYALPHEIECGLVLITPSTLCDVLRGCYAHRFDHVFVLDCRFQYEFEGGHVQGAQSVSNENALFELLQRRPLERGERACIVFHCEFSSQRGPALYKKLRDWDRRQHMDSYPQLYYPELYLLNGGYKRFHGEYIGMCEPRGYRTMFDPNYKSEMRVGLGTIAKSQNKSTRSMSMNDVTGSNELRRSLKW